MMTSGIIKMWRKRSKITQHDLDADVIKRPKVSGQVCHILLFISYKERNLNATEDKSVSLSLGSFPHYNKTSSM